MKLGMEEGGKEYIQVRIVLRPFVGGGFERGEGDLFVVFGKGDPVGDGSRRNKRDKSTWRMG